MNEKITKLINSYAGEDMDLCYYVLKIIMEEKEPEKGLQTFFENVKGRKSDKSHMLDKNFEMKELVQWDQLYSGYIQEFLLTIMTKAHMENWNKEQFYKSFWNKLKEDIIFETDKIKAFVIFKCAQNDIMPYFNIQKPLEMQNEEFEEILEHNAESISRIRHILALNFTQKTEVSSLILNELLNEKNFEEQSVILAVALHYYLQDKIKEYMQSVQKGDIHVEAQKE